MVDYSKIYPGPTRKILFDGGLNTKFSDNLIADNESPDMMNVIWEGKAIATRGGSQWLNTDAVGSAVCDGLFTRVDFNGNETMVAFFGGSGYYLSGTTWITIPSAQSVFTAGTRVYGAQDEGYLFVNNGGGQPYKYNGTDFTRHGIEAPTSTPVITSQASSVLTGDYQYKIAWVNTNLVQGDVGPAAATFAAASATLRVEIPVAPQSYGVAARNLYRTEAGGTTFKKVTMITNNTATTYDDNKPDSSLGVAAPTDQGKPPNWDGIIYHPIVGRLFFTDPSNINYVWYSEALNPYVVKASNFEYMGDKGGDHPRGFGLIENGVMVTCDRRPYIIYFPDNDPTNWIKAISRAQYGNICTDAIVDFNGGILCPATEYNSIVGFQNLVQTASDPSVTRLVYNSVSSDLVSENIEPDVLAIPKAYVRNIAGITHKNKVYFTVPYGDDATYNNRIYMLDFSHRDLQRESNDLMSVWAGVTPYPWYRWDNLFINNFTVYQGKLYGGCSKDEGHVYELNTARYADITDEVAAIDSYYCTKEFFGYPQDAENHKDFRFAYFLVDTYDDMYMGFGSKADSDQGVFFIKRIDIDNLATYWGIFVWGVDEMNAGIYQKDIGFDLGTLNGKRVQFKFSNLKTIDYFFKVHYMSFEYNLKGRR